MLNVCMQRGRSLESIEYCIPSYKRCGSVTTLDMLEQYHVPADNIFVGVQTEEDRESYTRVYGGRCNVVYTPNAHNAAGNRNGLLESVSGTVCLLDDDLKRIARVEPSVSKTGNETVKFVPLSSEEFNDLVNKMFHYGADIAGVNHVANGVYLRGSLLKNPVSRNVLIEGSFMLVCNDSLRFDENLSFTDDFELCFRTLAGGGFNSKEHQARYC